MGTREQAEAIVSGLGVVLASRAAECKLPLDYLIPAIEALRGAITAQELGITEVCAQLKITEDQLLCGAVMNGFLLNMDPVEVVPELKAILAAAQPANTAATN